VIALNGVAASSGAALGQFFLLTTEIPIASPSHSLLTTAEEIAILGSALEYVGADLSERAERSTGELRDILLAVAEIATDPALVEEAHIFIEQGHTSSYAISQATEIFKELLSSSGDYLAERVGDVANICDRILCRIDGVEYPEIPHFAVPTILIARDLSPADTTDLHSESVLAIVTEGGGPTSHTAIIARSRGIPAVVACPGVVEYARSHYGNLVSVDATTGGVIFDPPLETQSRVIAKVERIRKRKAQLVSRSPFGYQTLDGKTIPIYANIGSQKDVTTALEVGADGVGLLRTELLYLDRKTPPTLEEQTQIYTDLFAPFNDKKVVIRTLDAGADKPMAFINFDHEPNPALGIRGYRTVHIHEELLRIQLQAIANAITNTGTEVWVMAPMITLPQEAQDFADLARSYGIKTVGVMIEVPATIFQIDEITKICDFVSIGTNDLGQYLHAADRESAALAAFNDPWQPALLRAIHLVAQAGLRNNCPVGVCGEAASDAALAGVLLGLGVSSISCSISSLRDVAAAITAHHFSDLQLAAVAALGAGTSKLTRDLARHQLPALDDLGL
jgi:phosphotransferase system enzyme I (PtsI)